VSRLGTGTACLVTMSTGDCLFPSQHILFSGLSFPQFSGPYAFPPASARAHHTYILASSPE
jgi:hypothetical protein